MPSSQLELQQRLQHHLQSQQQNHGSHGERADLIGSVFAKTAAAAAKYSKDSAAAYSTVAISRSLTSGATLAATYKSSDESLTLKASVAF